MEDLKGEIPKNPNESNSKPQKILSLRPLISKKIIIILIVISIFSLFYAGVYLSMNSELSKITNPKKPSPVACTEEAKQCPDGSYVARTGPNCEFSPCNETSTWKTYKNEKYGFKLQYPAKGVIQIKDEQIEGQCGNGIKEDTNEIWIDNFYQIKIVNFSGSINEYIAQKGGKDKYELKEITGSSADEAIEVVGLKKGIEVVSVGYPPLMYIEYIYKKNSNIFLFVHSSHPPNPTNPNGCLNPEDLDPFKYKKYVDMNWQIPTSFKFL